MLSEMRSPSFVTGGTFLSLANRACRLALKRALSA